MPLTSKICCVFIVAPLPIIIFPSVTLTFVAPSSLHPKQSEARVWHFVQHPDGLHYFETRLDFKLNKSTNTAYCYIATVVENEKKFHRREVLQAQKVGELYRRLCWPSQSTLEHLISTNQIRKCPFTVADVKRFFYIYGPDAAALKGKTKKRNGDKNPPPILTTLPDDVLTMHRDVKLIVKIFSCKVSLFLPPSLRKLSFEPPFGCCG